MVIPICLCFHIPVRKCMLGPCAFLCIWMVAMSIRKHVLFRGAPMNYANSAVMTFLCLYLRFKIRWKNDPHLNFNGL